MNYEEALSAISNLAPRRWRLGIDRMFAFIEAAGLTSMLVEPNYVHVAGTNGKGSVTAYLQSIFCSAGQSTGAFFSPYVVDPRERVQIGRDLISKDRFGDYTKHLLEVERDFEFEGERGISEFEFKAALGFLAWKEAHCEWIALEVGLGGRYDATNIVTPRCSVIVSIGLDHVNILGHTLAEIAGEKAGIIKPGIPVVIGQMPEEAREVIEARANELSSPMWRYGQEILVSEGRVSTPLTEGVEIIPALTGSVQMHNASLAFAAAQLGKLPARIPQIQEGITRASLPGRFQRIEILGRETIVDGAHNHDSAVALANTLIQQGIQRIPMVIGMISGHDPLEFFEPLRPFASEVHLVPVDFVRGLATSVLSEALGGIGVPHQNLESAILSATQNSPAVITGSLYLAGEAIRLA